MFLLATLYQDSGDNQRAMQTYRDILASHPDHALALNNLAALLTKNDDAQAAVPLARRAAALLPQLRVQDTLGWALLRAGQATEAAAVLNHAHDMAPADPEALYRLAAAQVAAGDPHAGGQSLTKALAMSGDFRDAGAARQLLATLPRQ